MNIKLGEHFLPATFSISIIFKELYLVKMCPISTGLPLFLFTKYKNFLWICWLLCKHLTNLGCCSKKFHNPMDVNISGKFDSKWNANSFTLFKYGFEFCCRTHNQFWFDEIRKMKIKETYGESCIDDEISN